MAQLSNVRIIRAPQGTQLAAKSWLTEALLRMPMNNFDPEVAERPGDLVVYGGMVAPRAIGTATTASSPRCVGWRRTSPCWCNRASRSARSARTRTRRAC